MRYDRDGAAWSQLARLLFSVHPDAHRCMGKRVENRAPCPCFLRAPDWSAPFGAVPRAVVTFAVSRQWETAEGSGTPFAPNSPVVDAFACLVARCTIPLV
jgi:hypothetical protein